MPHVPVNQSKKAGTQEGLWRRRCYDENCLGHIGHFRLTEGQACTHRQYSLVYFFFAQPVPVQWLSGVPPNSPAKKSNRGEGSRGGSSRDNRNSCDSNQQSSQPPNLDALRSMTSSLVRRLCGPSSEEGLGMDFGSGIPPLSDFLDAILLRDTQREEGDRHERKSMSVDRLPPFLRLSASRVSSSARLFTFRDR